MIPKNRRTGIGHTGVGSQPNDEGHHITYVKSPMEIKFSEVMCDVSDVIINIASVGI